MSIAEITSIGGSKPGKRSLPGQPVPEVVEELESLLERAKSGEIVAIAFGFVMDHSGVICMDGGYAYRGQMTSDLFVALSLVKSRFENYVFDPSQD